MNFLFDDDRSYDEEDEIGFLYNYDESITQSASDCSSSRSSLSHDHEQSPQAPMKSRQKGLLRKQLSKALTSPVRAARNTLASPNKHTDSKQMRSKKKKLSSPKMQKELKSWQKEFDLPADITREQAMAIIICRELEMMDL